MRYIRVTGGNGYCGCDFEEVFEVDDNVTTEEIENIARELTYENAESYSYVVTGWNEDFESEEDEEAYFMNAYDYTNWEEITKATYDRYFVNIV